jgi:plasmid stabilization system protein ParE
MRILDVVLLPSALENLADITGYISHKLHNPVAAHRLVDNFYKKVSGLKDYPEMYSVHKSDAVKTVFRKITLGNYLIFYTVGEKYVYVAFVLHSKQDVDRILEMY